MSLSWEDLRARVATSACLLGQRVRYDGGHKEHPLLRGGLRPWITLVPLCPEAELGLGTPRAPIQLVDSGEGIRLRACSSAQDHTEAMASFAAGRIAELVRQGLDGGVLKSRSPSCGLAVEVHGSPRPRLARGRFAEALALEEPLLPLCEEGDLEQPARLERFLHRVRVHAWLRQVEGPNPSAWASFHAAQAPHLDPAAHARLGALLASADLPGYRRELLTALADSIEA